MCIDVLCLVIYYVVVGGFFFLLFVVQCVVEQVDIDGSGGNGYCWVVLGEFGGYFVIGFDGVQCCVGFDLVIGLWFEVVQVVIGIFQVVVGVVGQVQGVFQSVVGDYGQFVYVGVFCFGLKFSVVCCL